MGLRSKKLAIVGSVILIIASTSNPGILGDYYGMRSQTMITRVTGQEIGIAWNQTYETSGAAHDLIQTPDGGFALVGTAWPRVGLTEMMLVKTAADGVKEWNQTYGGADYDYAYALVQTFDGGFALLGYTWSFGAGENDMWLVKTNADGVMEWDQTYGGTSEDRAYAIIQTSDGGFAMSGYTRSFGVTNNDRWLVKTDADGVMEWNQTYETDIEFGNDDAGPLIQTSDGGFALAGSDQSFTGDMWLVKTEADGAMEWDMTYGGAHEEGARGLIQTSDGGFALAGTTNSFGAGETDMLLVKTDADGVKEWNQTYGGIERDSAWDLIQTSAGGFAIAGDTWSFGAGGSDMWLVITGADGAMKWNQTYGGNETDRARALIQNTDESLALAGSTGSFGVGTWLVKTEPIGDSNPDDISSDNTNGFLELEFFPGLMIVLILMYSYRKRNHVLK